MGVGAEDEVGRAVGVEGEVIAGNFSTGGLVAVETGSDGTGVDGGGAEQAARRKTTMVKEEL